ncbi:MAG: alpha/beta hydrolase-fold protein [Saprospiraceae bacterium]|nr:alpha/beta hydrolase-fold protein [Saprospiraceae bacterium]MDZ4703834.1 alpha/beta hydrolase-fold protein [Saprospiraceae bacterium]
MAASVVPDSKIIVELRTPDARDLPVFLTGNFNEWQVGDSQFRLEKVKKGLYRFEFPNKQALPEVIEYKYVRGSWDQVELDSAGNEIFNRFFHTSGRLIADVVPRWRRSNLTYNPLFLPDIRVISQTFKIPQLIKTRRIAALLPHDYSRTDRRYPVLYLQDGQNLFDDHAPFGSWSVDKKLAELAEKGFGDVIVIAIDHAAEARIAEFTPSYPTRLGTGEGKKYARFMKETLKPYVDTHFRTLPDRQNTGIGGSSMGGLISFYAGLMFPEVYSKLMIFSPSLWVAPNIHHQSNDLRKAYDTKIYLYGGGAESAGMAPSLIRIKETLERQGQGSKMDILLAIDPRGKHNEARWGKEFPRAIKWLFYKK